MLDNVFIRFILQTVWGLRFFLIQMMVWLVLDLLIRMLGLNLYWGRFGILAFALQICIFTYTLLYSWFYAFVPLKSFPKTFFLPYLIYMVLVYIGIVADHAWNFKIVSIDRYMMIGWLIPLYGAILFCAKWKCTKLLELYPKVLKLLRIIVNALCVILFFLLLPVLLLRTFL